MANNPRTFLIEMYEEHLEEASFLYEQRLGLIDDPELTWVELRPFEDRLEAHLDALVVGGDLARGVCRRRALEGDPGELYAALCVLCRVAAKDDALETIASLDPEDAERMDAAFDGLRLALPEAWRGDLEACGRPLEDAVPSGTTGLLLAARIAADRGVDPGAAVRAVLAGAANRRTAATAVSVDAPAAASAAAPAAASRETAGGGLASLRRAAIRALAAAGRDEDQPSILACLRDPAPAIQREAARALLSVGRGEAIEWLAKQAPLDPECALLLALAADRRSAVTLSESVRKDAGRPEAPLVLGLLGDPAAVPWLIEKLRAEPSGPDAPAAAEALWLITGAPILETVEEAAGEPAGTKAGAADEVAEPGEEPAEERSAEPAERAPEDRADGTALATAVESAEEIDGEGEPPSTEDAAARVRIHRPAPDPARWETWWRSEGPRFRPGLRHLLGQPVTAKHLVAALADAGMPNRLRRLLATEAAFRYALHLLLTVDQPVRVQERRLQRAGAAAVAADAKLEPGAWAFGGAI